MRNLGSTKLTLLCGLLLAACGGDDSGDNGPGDTSTDVVVSADIDADTTWTADNVYVLDSNVFVRGATLTIEPGTTIRGRSGSSLIITATAQIDAQGSADAPIVFTSDAPEGARAPGDWGGIALLGNAPINVYGGSDSLEGFAAGTTGTEYGGTDAAHNCGSIRYVRIEFGGFELSPDNELNGLTVAACGSETVLDYIHVHRGADDGIEFFGGTADLRDAVVTQADDDGLDWDFGWQGNVQFLIVQQGATAGNCAFESDNNKNDNNATPRSSPTIWNATLIGSNAEPGQAFKTQCGMMLRRGTGGSLNNMIVAYFTDSALDIADYATVQQTEGSEPGLAIRSSLFFDNANDENKGFPAMFDVRDDVENDCETENTNCLDESALVTAAAWENMFDTDPGLADPLNINVPSFAPGRDTAPLSMGATPGAGFDATATYAGAIGDTDWTLGWTSYPMN